MSVRRSTFYVEPSAGIAVAGLLQILEVLGAHVVKTPPPPEESASYIVIDFGKRRSQAGGQKWVGAWYEARAELNHPGTLIGLTLEEGNNPVSGACPISGFHVLPQIIRLFDRAPQALSEAEVNRQKQPTQKRQAEIIGHDLQHVLNASDLSANMASRTLTATLQTITLPPLRSELNDLLKKIEKVTDAALLRNLLTTALANGRKRHEQ